MRNRETDPCYH